MRVTKEDLEVFPELVTIGGLAMHRTVYIDGKLIDLADSHRVMRASEGFDWGYKGSGPAQFAFAILWHFLNRYIDKEGNIIKEDPEAPQKFARTVELAGSMYKAFNLVLIKQLPQMNFEIEVCLRELLLGMNGLSDEPVNVMYLYVHNLLEKGDTIAAFRYAGSHRENVVLSDNVENKVVIKQTGEGTYDIDV